jgi:hypothetical protein
VRHPTAKYKHARYGFPSNRDVNETTSRRIRRTSTCPQILALKIIAGLRSVKKQMKATSKRLSALCLFENFTSMKPSNPVPAIGIHFINRNLGKVSGKESSSGLSNLKATGNSGG